MKTVTHRAGDRITHVEYDDWSGEIIFIDEDGMLHVKWDTRTATGGLGYISPLRVIPERPHRQCSDCGADGPVADTAEEALSAWNTRQQVTPAESQS